MIDIRFYSHTMEWLVFLVYSYSIDVETGHVENPAYGENVDRYEGSLIWLF